MNTDTKTQKLELTVAEVEEISTYTLLLDKFIEVTALFLANHVDTLFATGHVINQGELENWVAEDVSGPLIDALADELRKTGQYVP